MQLHFRGVSHNYVALTALQYSSFALNDQHIMTQLSIPVPDPDDVSCLQPSGLDVLPVLRCVGFIHWVPLLAATCLSGIGTMCYSLTAGRLSVYMPCKQ